MSVRYRNQSGIETIVSGLTPGGDIEAGAVMTRTGTVNVTVPANSNATGYVTFDEPMPDVDYIIDLQETSGTGGLGVTIASGKSTTGFSMNVTNTNSIQVSTSWKYIATKTYTVQHAQQNAESIATIEAMIPSGAGAGNKLTPKSYVDNADNALDGRLDDIEDVIPATASITNQLVTTQQLAAIENATSISYDNTDSGLIADDVQEAIDELTDIDNNLQTKINKEIKTRTLVSGHNILKNKSTYTFTTSSGITYTRLSDGSVLLEGDTTGQSTNSYYALYYTEDINEYLKDWANKQVIVSGSGSNLISLHIEMNSVAILTDVAQDTEFTMPSTFNTRFGIYIRVDKTAGAINQTFYPMIRYKEDLNTEWTPYSKTNQELTIDKAEENTIFNVYGAKNLITYPYQNADFGKGKDSYTFNGITYTDNGDGSITMNGTATGTMSYCNFLIAGTSPMKLKNGKYILSGVPEGLPSGCRMYVDRTMPSSGAVSNYGYNYPGIEFLFTVTGDYYNDDYASVGVGIIISGGTTVNNAIVKPMIRAFGVQDNTWQPFVKTNKQLTTDKAEENAVFNVYGAKNLLASHYNRTVTAGVTFTINKNDSVTVSGTPTTDCYIEYIPNLEPRKYILSGLTDECENVDIRLYVYNNNTNVLQVTFTTPGDHIVDLSDYTFNSAKFYINRTSNDIACSGTIYPMIRLADIKDNTFAPGTMTNKELTDAVANTNIFSYSTMATVSSTNNPLSYAESMINSTPSIRIHYIGVKNNSGYSAGAPCGYTVYTLKQVSDAITVEAIEYGTGRIYTNGRSKAGAWSGWKISPAT